MSFRSLGMKSEIVVLGDAARIDWRQDVAVLRTPEQPDFWFGNSLIFRHRRVEPAAQIAAFRAEFPTARHIVLQWDDPQMVPDARHDALRAQGFDIEAVDVLTLSKPVQESAIPIGYDVRALRSETDWDQLVALSHDIGVTEDGHDPDLHLGFVRDHVAAHRRAVNVGRAEWFGAFHGGTLAAALGIYVSTEVARFQSVMTAAPHRRRGLCAALIPVAIRWAKSKEPDAVPVIIAMSDEPPGRIYRRAGFALAEKQVSACRRPEKGVNA